MNADVHALAGAYALDALPPEEAATFAEHLADCGACQQEVAELQITAAQLGLGLSQAPPPALRDRVLRAVHQTRQVPPITPPGDLDARRRRPSPRLLAAAAALLVVLGGAVLAIRPALDGADPTPSDAVAAVLNAPDAQSATARLRGGGSMTVVSSDRLDRAVVLGDDLPSLAPDRVYQLWLVNPEGEARSADVLIGPDTTAVTSRLVRGVRARDSIAITREPAGGSQQPTMTPLAVVDET